MSSNLSTLYKSLLSWDAEADFAALVRLSQDYAALPKAVYGKSTETLRTSLADFIEVEKKLYHLKLQLLQSFRNPCQEAAFYVYLMDADAFIRKPGEVEWEGLRSSDFIPLPGELQIRVESGSIVIIPCDFLALWDYLGSSPRGDQAITDLATSSNEIYLFSLPAVVQLEDGTLSSYFTINLPPLLVGENCYERPYRELGTTFGHLVDLVNVAMGEAGKTSAADIAYIPINLTNCFGIDPNNPKDSVNWNSWEQVPYDELGQIIRISQNGSIRPIDELVQAVVNDSCFESDPFIAFYPGIASALSDLTGLNVTEDDAKFLVSLVLEIIFEMVFPYAEIVLFLRSLSQGDYVGALLEILPMDTFIKWIWRRFGKAAAEAAVITMMGNLPELADEILKIAKSFWKWFTGEAAKEGAEEVSEEIVEETAEEVIETTSTSVLRQAFVPKLTFVIPEGYILEDLFKMSNAQLRKLGLSSKDIGTLEVIRGRIRQNEVAEHLIRQKYEVINEPTADELWDRARYRSTYDPDYIINNKVYDSYAPAPSTSVDNIWWTISGKSKTQASRVVLILDDSTIDMEDLIDKLNVEAYPFELGELEEVMIIKEGIILYTWTPN